MEYEYFYLILIYDKSRGWIVGNWRAFVEIPLKPDEAYSLDVLNHLGKNGWLQCDREDGGNIKKLTFVRQRSSEI